MTKVEMIYKGFSFILIINEEDFDPPLDHGNGWEYLFEAKAELFVITSDEVERLFYISYMVNPHQYAGKYTNFVGTGYRVYPKGSIFGPCSRCCIQHLEEAKKICIEYRDDDVQKLILDPLKDKGIIAMLRRLSVR